MTSASTGATAPEPPPFEVLPFSSANLFRALSNKYCRPDEVATQDQSQYLYRYLHDIGAKTIVVELDYIDGDYLEDFASYYVRCFEPYERCCRRLHFFSEDFQESALREVIAESNTENCHLNIQKCYLGFCVARPLPSTIVGRTLLQTYPSDNGRRHYTAVRTYDGHLFGKKLSLISLPFQEQDSVLAACATVALWCAFHKTAQLFGTTAPRPAVITGSANGAVHRGRPVPSHGLSIEEMCHAVRDIGLEPELIDCVDKNIPLVSLIYGHLKMGIPVVLIVDIEHEGLHAITLTGYSLREKRVLVQEVSGTNKCIPMIGLRIDEFYGHDDQIGPFSRLHVGPSANIYPVLFSGDWKDKATEKQLVLQPVAVLIPVYNKIRVTFLDVQVWLTRLTSVLGLIVPDANTSIEWDVSLTTTNDYKETIQTISLLPGDLERLLLKCQPRFMWRAILRVSGIEVLDLLVDATDMARSFPIIEAIWRHQAFRSAMRTLLTATPMQQSLNDALTRRFLDLLKNSLK